MKKLKEESITEKSKEKVENLKDKKTERKRLLSKIGKIILIVIILYLIVIEVLGIIRRSKIRTINSPDSTCTTVVVKLYETKFRNYYLGDGCSYTVYYKDGSKESLEEAFAHKKVTSGDALRYGIFIHSRWKWQDKNYYDYSKDDDVYIVSKIEDNNSSDNCLDMIDVFYSDNKYDYSFNCINNNIIVTYANGKTEEIHEAFQNKHVTIKDLDKFNISYQKLERQVTVKAINIGVSNSGCNLEKTIIYSDDTYNYYIKNTCYTVVFSDGSKEPIEEAFKNNKISIKDLDNLNFNYTKEAK